MPIKRIASKIIGKRDLCYGNYLYLCRDYAYIYKVFI